MDGLTLWYQENRRSLSRQTRLTLIPAAVVKCPRSSFASVSPKL